MGRIVCYGCVREVDILEDLDIGIQALAAIPVAPTARISGKPICRSTSAASPSCRMTTSVPIPQGDPLPDALDIE